MQTLTRRQFVRDGALLAATVVWAPRRRVVHRAAPLRIALIDGAGARAAARRAGVDLGIDEARHAAAMFGGGVELTMMSSRRANLARLSAIIGDDGASFAEEAERSGIPYMNVACADDDLRGARCHATLFHVAPSAAMMRDARALARAPVDARVEAWDASLEKFGADTLNQRFTSRFASPMTSDAWTAWFAVKVLWEASLRARSTEPAQLAAYLARESTQFDGHKGRPLSFRTWDRQLRQPVYIASASRVTECPPAASADESARESLDRIGTPRATTECKTE